MCIFYSSYFFLSFLQRCNSLLSLQEMNPLAVAKKAWKSPSYCYSAFDSGVISGISYRFLMLILCDQLFILITTVHHCFLSKKNLVSLPGHWPFCPCFAFSSFHLLLWYVPPRHTHTQHFCSGCDLKKITPYRKFFRNLNFKNIVNFLKRTCCHFYLKQSSSFLTFNKTVPTSVWFWKSCNIIWKQIHGIRHYFFIYDSLKNLWYMWQEAYKSIALFL